MDSEEETMKERREESGKKNKPLNVNLSLSLNKNVRLVKFHYSAASMTKVKRSLKADSHIACRAHAALMPFPCYAVR